MTHTIHRLPDVKSASGYSRSTIYLRISQGLWTKPVSLGARAVGWPAYEIAALNAARIAGKTDQEIRTLVVNMETARKVADQEYLGAGILPIATPDQGSVHSAATPALGAPERSAASTAAPLAGEGSDLYVLVTRKGSPSSWTNGTER